MNRPAEIPEGGSTGHSHEHSEAISEAARFVVLDYDARLHGRGLVPILRERWGLSVREACDAIHEAGLIRARAT